MKTRKVVSHLIQLTDKKKRNLCWDSWIMHLKKCKVTQDTMAAMPKKAYPVECNQHKKVICRIKLTRRHKLLNRCLEESVHHYLVKYNRSRHKLKLSIMVKIKNKTKTKTKIQISQNKLTHHKKKLRCPKPHRKMANQI